MPSPFLCFCHNDLRNVLFAVLVVCGLVPRLNAATLLVPHLPADNLVKNPWFRNAGNTGPGMDHWLTDGHWGATDKDGNPTPDSVLGTCARISTGRGDREAGKTVDVGVHTYLSQIVAADPAKRKLTFDMYWVTHTLNPGEVLVYGSDFPEGPWQLVWRPFYQVFTKVLIPESGRGQDLWTHYSGLTDLVSTNLAEGYQFYKLEIHAVLPDSMGGFKITGLYFSASDLPAAPLKIDRIWLAENSLQISFQPKPGLLYSVQEAKQLPAISWRTLTNFVGANEISEVVAEVGSLDESPRFYRVLEQAGP